MLINTQDMTDGFRSPVSVKTWERDHDGEYLIEIEIGTEFYRSVYLTDLAEIGRYVDACKDAYIY